MDAWQSSEMWLFSVMGWAFALLLAWLWQQERRARLRKSIPREVAERAQAVEASDATLPRAVSGSGPTTTAPTATATASFGASPSTAELQASIHALESFTRSVAHDLRGPLGSMASLARIAHQGLQQGDAAAALRCLPVIAARAELSSKLVQALLTLARVSDSELHCRELDLRALVQEVLDQLATMPEAGVWPRIRVADLPHVKADPDVLRPALLNLISNALKFTRDQAQGLVEIGTQPPAHAEGERPTAMAQGMVSIYVRDNGVGFDSQVAHQLFEPFTRLHGAQFEGHGLGLSIVRRAVERHQGRVWVESAPGAGACFHISLPLAA